jgi:hypothetical protein
MNERIKELAEQATTTEKDGFQYFDKAKFAELIVLECATICKDTAEKQFNPLYNRESDGATVCYKKIRDYFGIEQ